MIRQPGEQIGGEQGHVIGFESAESRMKRVQSRERKPEPELRVETGLSLKRLEMPADSSLANLEHTLEENERLLELGEQGKLNLTMEEVNNLLKVNARLRGRIVKLRQHRSDAERLASK
ncbi:MAG: hypothetical protein ABIA47_01805 [bacterium]